MKSDVIYPGRNQSLWVYGLTNNGDYVDSATISLSMQDPAGVSYGPFAFDFISGPQTVTPYGCSPGSDTTYAGGNYQAAIAGATTAPYPPGTIYAGIQSITISAVTEPVPVMLIAYPPTSQSGYGNVFDIKREMGSVNARAAADPDVTGNNAEIALNEQWACSVADEFINSALQRNSFAIPATVNLPIIKTIWAKIASWQLYQTRGMEDKDVKGTRFSEKYSWGKDQLEELMFMNRGGFARVSGYSDAPHGVTATVDLQGNRVCKPCWPVPTWNGIFWTWG